MNAGQGHNGHEPAWRSAVRAVEEALERTLGKVGDDESGEVFILWRLGGTEGI